MKLKTRLFSVFIGFVAVPFLVIAAISVFSIKSNYDENLLNERVALAKQCAYELNRYISDVEDLLDVITNLPEIKDFANPKKQEAILRLLKERLGNLDYLYMADKEGRVTLSAPYTDFGGDTDWSNRSWFNYVLEEKKAYTSPSSMISDANQQPIVFMAVPIFGVDKSVEGVLGANISLRKMSEPMNKMKFGETGEVFVIDEHGYVIIHPDYNQVLNREKTYIVEAAPKNEVLFKTADEQSSPKIVVTYPMRASWTVVVSQDKAEAYYDFGQIISFLVILAFTVIGAAFFASLRISEKLADPLSQLTAVTNNLASGYSIKPLDVRGKDEISILSESFNSMAESIVQRDLELRDAFIKISEILVNLLELKDTYTAGHSKTVESLAMRIGQKMGLSESELNNLQIAAILHDIGKIGIGEALLNKAAPLTEAEWQIVKTHPVKGAEALHGIEGFREIAKCIRHHHEMYGGGGYPDGLQGQEIPLSARIISVADAFDAMNSDRAYRKALSREVIQETINKEKGRQFDPLIVLAFFEIMAGDNV